MQGPCGPSELGPEVPCLLQKQGPAEPLCASPEQEDVVARQVVDVLCPVEQHKLRQDGHRLQVDGELPENLRKQHAQATLLSAAAQQLLLSNQPRWCVHQQPAAAPGPRGSNVCDYSLHQQGNLWAVVLLLLHGRIMAPCQTAPARNARCTLAAAGCCIEPALVLWPCLLFGVLPHRQLSLHSCCPSLPPCPLPKMSQPV